MKSLNSSNTSRAYLSALVHFNNLLSPNHTVETILEFLLQKKMDVYELLNSFIAYLSDNVSRKTATLYLAAEISYFGFRDIDIIPAKFKKRVTVPKLYKKPEQTIDAKDIRKILLACTGAGNRRLKAYLLLLASGGMRLTSDVASDCVILCDGGDRDLWNRRLVRGDDGHAIGIKPKQEKTGVLQII